MNARLFITLLALSVTFFAHAQDTPTDEQVERLVRAAIFARTPDFNPNINIRKVEVKGLWEEMKIEVAYVDTQNQGKTEPYGFAIYHDGKIVSLESYCGLLSGLVNNGEFYYTWAWGSGIGRSQVVRLRIAGGRLEILQSGEFWYQDLIVSTSPGGKVQVLSGMFRGLFNHVDAAKEIGFVRSTNSSELQIIDANGKVVAPTTGPGSK
jgi:hypothetical protein